MCTGSLATEELVLLVDQHLLAGDVHGSGCAAMILDLYCSYQHPRKPLPANVAVPEALITSSPTSVSGDQQRCI